MTILNYKEKQLQIVYNRITCERESSFLTNAILSAIRWNSLCDHTTTYDADGLNVAILVNLITHILNYSVYKDDTMIIVFRTTEPGVEKKNLLKALAAAVRWNGILSGSEAVKDDGDDLQVIATLMEVMFEEKKVVINN